MNPQEDIRWHNLIAMSAPSFAGDAAPPYGFLTSTLARLRDESRQMELAERIGLRALLASLAVLLLAGGLTVGTEYLHRGSSDMEPGLRGIVQVENVPLS